MQRLFSTFPSAWPGVGLLLLRVAASVPLLMESGANLGGLSQLLSSVSHLLAIAVGIFLLAGLWTPIAGLLQAILEIRIAVSSRDELALHILLATLGVGLTMLGPGAWSIDALLFGRKRIDFSDH